LARQQWQPELLRQRSDCSALNAEAEDQLVASALEAAAASFPNVEMQDSNSLVCPDARCFAKLGEHILFRDSQHLTNKFVEAQAGEIMKKLGH
jgi:hypothetical protein